MKTSLKEKLIIFAKGKWPHFVNTGEFQRLAMTEGFVPSNASRRCRELENAGVLERRMAGKSVEYRYKSISNIFRPEYSQAQKLKTMKLI